MTTHTGTSFGKLVGIIALFTVLGIPVLAFLWETLNKLIAGVFEPWRLLVSTGSGDPRDTELAPEEEPVTTGTLFLTIVLLMIIGGIWVVMYGFLLGR
jgi:flagellar biogenesis protein FliO